MYAAVGPGRFAFTSSILDQFLCCKHEGTVVAGPGRAGPGRAGPVRAGPVRIKFLFYFLYLIQSKR